MAMKTHSAAWYDSMYNNRALVPDHAAHFADWSKTSADARAALKCTLNIAYGDGPNESLDIFPASKPNAPVVVFGAALTKPIIRLWRRLCMTWALVWWW